MFYIVLAHFSMHNTPRYIYIFIKYTHVDRVGGRGFRENSTFVHEGGLKNGEKLSTWYMDGPYR